MKSLPPAEYQQILDLLERRSRSLARRHRLGESDVDEMVSIGLRVAGQQWPRWVSDGDVTLEAFIWAHARHELWGYVDEIRDRRRQEVDTDYLADTARGDDQEHDGERLARLEQLADQHLAVRVYLANEHGEGAATTISRLGLKGRRGRGAMAFCDLSRLRTEGHARVVSDPVLRQLSGLAPAPVRDLTPLELAALEVRPSTDHFRQDDSREGRTQCRPRSGHVTAPPACRTLRVKRVTAAGFTFRPAAPRPAGCKTTTRVHGLASSHGQHRHRPAPGRAAREGSALRSGPAEALQRWPHPGAFLALWAAPRAAPS